MTFSGKNATSGGKHDVGACRHNTSHAHGRRQCARVRVLLTYSGLIHANATDVEGAVGPSMPVCIAGLGKAHAIPDGCLRRRPGAHQLLPSTLPQQMQMTSYRPAMSDSRGRPLKPRSLGAASPTTPTVKKAAPPFVLCLLQGTFDTSRQRPSRTTRWGTQRKFRPLLGPAPRSRAERSKNVSRTPLGVIIGLFHE